MQLKQYDQALKHANEANIRESNLATHFLSFLIQLHVPDDEKGITTVRWCCPCTLNSFCVQLRQSLLHSALATISIQSISTSLQRRRGRYAKVLFNMFLIAIMTYGDIQMKRQAVAMHALEAIMSTFISADRLGHIGKVLRNLVKLSTNGEERYLRHSR
jgi:hypothetical protein